MVSCILLAAGESKRFGSAKPLARLGPGTVIEHIQRSLLGTRLCEIIVTLGAQADAIVPHILKDPRIKHVLNKDYGLGQTSSFKTGLNAVQPESRAVMLLPADMPLIHPLTFDLLLDTFMKTSPLILLPTYQGKNGHPPVFSMSLKQEMLGMKNEEPLSGIQHKYSSGVLKVPVDDEGIILSFNTPEELKELVKKSKSEV